MLAVDHRIWSGTLFGEVDDSFGLEGLNHRREKITVRDVADKELDGVSGDFLPGLEAVGEKTNGSQRSRAEFMVPLAAQEVIDDRYRMSFL